MTEKILNAIKELREKSKKRNFVQTFDLIITLKEIDIKKPENKFSEELALPFGKGKEARVVVFSDTIKDAEFDVLTSEDVVRLAKNKREAKKFISKTDFFLAEPNMMPTIGKYLGAFLAPRGKMPKLITGNVRELVEKYKRSVKIKVKDSPTIQCAVGNENMDNSQVAENISSILKYLEEKLPKGKNNISKILLKLTMSKPVKIEV